MQKEEFLWNVIKRYDSYYSVTNTKASIILAFNTILFSGLVFKWDDIITLYKNKSLIFVMNIIIFIVAFLSLISLFFMLKIVLPYLKSTKRIGQYQSKIFFGHVSEYSSDEDYLKAINNLKGEDLTKDLTFQAYSLAKGLYEKFELCKIAFRIISIGQLPLIAISIFFKMVDILINKG
jgi:hypothetical protein